MVSELKIVMSGPNTHNVLVSVDNVPVGFIQEIKFHASVGGQNPLVEIVFPNLFSEQVDSSYYKNSPIPKELAATICRLCDVPNVKVTLAEIW